MSPPVERRFATTMREADRDEPGLIQEDDGTIWLVAAGGARAQLPGMATYRYDLAWDDPGLGFSSSGRVIHTVPQNSILLGVGFVTTEGWPGNPGEFDNAHLDLVTIGGNGKESFLDGPDGVDTNPDVQMDHNFDIGPVWARLAFDIEARVYYDSEAPLTAGAARIFVFQL